MGLNLENELKLFMLFDILGDTERSGPLLWHIERKRLEDVKNHILDLLLIIRILRNHIGETLDYEKITDYIIIHDLPEAITGDITKFEGISNEEKERVNTLAIEYISKKFSDIMDFNTLFKDYEECNDIEAKIVNLVDRVHSATTFLKYSSEQEIDMLNPKIIPILRNNPIVVKMRNEGRDLGEIFYAYHIGSIKITEEDCLKLGITYEEGARILNIIKTFAEEMYKQKKNKTLFIINDDLPSDAMIYNRKYQN